MIPFGLAGSSHLTSTVRGLRATARTFFGGVPGAEMINDQVFKTRFNKKSTQLLVYHILYRGKNLWFAFMNDLHNHKCHFCLLFEQVHLIRNIQIYILILEDINHRFYSHKNCFHLKFMIVISTIDISKN